ncbi:DUF167 domain-containing protein [Marivita sp. S0852]|uniref:DUF167 domain-containing protein n=1 Tax=Marivita sp. S0852 TaxID=3373893 RepID=UPI00398253F1
MSKNSLASRAQPGARYQVYVTPNARRTQVEMDAETIKISVTAPAQNGSANKAVVQTLAKVLGVAKSRLTLKRGHKSRYKVFQLD